MRRERIDFRLLELENEFYDYVESVESTPSKVLRQFTKQGLSENGKLTIKQQGEIKKEIIELRKSMLRIGGNLNQIAQYFNTHQHLTESDLHQQLCDAKQIFKDTTKALNAVQDVI